MRVRREAWEGGGGAGRVGSRGAAERRGETTGRSAELAGGGHRTWQTHANATEQRPWKEQLCGQKSAHVSPCAGGSSDGWKRGVTRGDDEGHGRR